MHLLKQGSKKVQARARRKKHALADSLNQPPPDEPHQPGPQQQQQYDPSDHEETAHKYKKPTRSRKPFDPNAPL